MVQLGRFRGRIDVEDTPFWAVAYDPDTGELELTDGSAEPVAAHTLRLDPDGALRCAVKRGRFPARFTRAGQSHLLHAIDRVDGALRLRAGRELLPLPQLEGPG